MRYARALRTHLLERGTDIRSDSRHCSVTTSWTRRARYTRVATGMIAGIERPPRGLSSSQPRKKRARKSKKERPPA